MASNGLMDCLAYLAKLDGKRRGGYGPKKAQAIEKKIVN